MATTTTNYGFDVPQSSDLVKNGATQIALLGQDIDTFLFRPFAKNVIINGNLDWWQRGTTFTGIGLSGTYLADRWTANEAGTNANMTVTQDTSVPNANSKYSIKFTQTTTGATSVTGYNSRQFIEQSNILPLLGKSCIVSFWYRSNKTGSHGLRIYAGYNTGGGDQTTTFTVNAANTWEYKTVAVTAFSTVSASSASPTSSGALLDIGFNCNGSGFSTLSASDFFQFTQVQLEVGSVATPFTRAGGAPIQGELSACQRYYYRITGVDGYTFGAGQCFSTTNAGVIVTFPVTMRIRPTALEQSGTANLYRVLNASGTGLACSSVPAYYPGSQGSANVSMTVSSGLVAGNATIGAYHSAGEGYLGWSAEL